jgi:hypothetical protein
MPACYEKALCRTTCSLSTDANLVVYVKRSSMGFVDGFITRTASSRKISARSVKLPCIILYNKNQYLTIHGLPPLPFFLTPQEVAQLIPEIAKRLESELVTKTSQHPDPKEPTIPVQPTLPPRSVT